VYYRLGKDDRLLVPGLNGQFQPGRLQVVRDGHDVALIAMGTVSVEAVAAADALAARGVSCSVAVLASIRPAPVQDLADFLGRHRFAVTVEGHYLDGGAGSLVAETIAEQGLRTRLVRCGVSPLPRGEVGSQFLHARYRLDAASLEKTVLRLLDGKNP
jgi:transketolase